MRIRKRLEFEDLKFSKRIIIPENTDEIGENESGNAADAVSLEFNSDGRDLGGYSPQYAAAVTGPDGSTHPGMGGWPETEISFAVTEEDLPRVNAWFTDDYRGVTSPESTTLQKNRTSAIRSVLSNYFSSASVANRFTSPFRLGWRYRYKDGSSGAFHDCGVMSVFATAPRLPITRYSISGKTLYTALQIRNIPARLRYRVVVSDETALAEITKNVDFIEVFATKPVPLYDPSTDVAGVRSIVIDGEPKRCWYYTSYDESEVILRAKQDNDFRRIGVISADEIGKNRDYTDLPMSAGTLTGFSRLPGYEESGTQIPSAPPGSKFLITTSPLHLGYPDSDKRLHSVYLRGVFPRDKVRMRIYGSHHREQWHLIAETTGPMISGLLGMRWRWFLIEIESPVREGDFFEALTFVVNV